MIYCVVPQELADELYDKLVAYYADDPNVEVIVDRRKGERRRARRRPAAATARSATGAGSASPGNSPRSSCACVVHVDGGARGNPGPAAIGAVISTPDGEVSTRPPSRIGEATNNVAEYRALLLGLERARELGATEVELVNDSELVARQVQGAYKVKHPGLRPLYDQAMEALRGFERWSVRSVPRAQNAHADQLVNAALDAQG